MTASIVVTTKNRKDSLRRALLSAICQTANPEVIVIDDGSDDGTSEMVKSEFPMVKLYSEKESRGLIVRRNQAAALATGEILFSIDDDAEFSNSTVVDETLKNFSDERVGAVAIPFIEPNKKNILMQCGPDSDNTWITEKFIGTAHALIRNVFINLGGYREHLVHQGEEGDYCIRLIDAGYYVRLGSSAPILHFESPIRDRSRMDFYGSRNPLLFVWENVPWPIFPIHFVGTMYKVLVCTFEPSRFFLRVNAVLWAIRLCAFGAVKRRPVRQKSYRLYRRVRIPHEISTLPKIGLG